MRILRRIIRFVGSWKAEYHAELSRARLRQVLAGSSSNWERKFIRWIK